MTAKPVILCIDDEPMILSNLDDQIGESLGDKFDVELAESGEEGLEIIQDLQEEGKHCAVIVCDQLMPNMKGEDFIIQSHKLIPHTLKIMLTGQASLESVGRTINNAQLFRYLTKPWKKDELVETVTEATEIYKEYMQLVQYTKLMKALSETTRELSGDKDAASITNKFIESVINNVGAERGYLILNHNPLVGLDPETYMMQGELTKFNREFGIQQEKLTDEVEKTIESQLKAKPGENDSALATQLTYKDKVLGKIYIENTISKTPFSENHKEVLDMLAAQAAISIENAQLYNRLLQQNEDVVNSIRYAKRIQEAIMPKKVELQTAFPNSFTYYKAKDIVSGDFYWWSIKPNRAIIAAVDCTGHGVPGAFMSVIGHNFLQQITNMPSNTDPAFFLQFLHKKVRDTLNKQQITDNPKDGMDIALAIIDRKKKTLQYAGARRPFWYVRDGEFLTQRGSKCSIGEVNVPKENQKFESLTLELKTGDSIYLTTDGAVDQFGGPDNKKFGKKQLTQVILEGEKIDDPKERMAHLDNALMSWMKAGKTELTDDNLIINVRID